ncbi:hypothetical protein [Leyella stercorea]|uniref:hypothetical protein n=1 Tax=Leyella stercorea TaxID=363265 RepID=UPI003FEEADA4
MIGHRNLAFSEEIEKAFNAMPIPDKYNDHNVGKRIFYTSERKLKVKKLDSHYGFKINDMSDKKAMNDFDLILQQQYIASRLVARWFQRKKSTGVCSMELVQERGYNNASEVEKRLAAHSIRKDALLRDAGEELIGSTFVLINDIRYIDKSKGSAVIGGIVSAAIQANRVMSGSSDLGEADLGKIIATYKGFNVKINTYLYQLVWDKDISSFFYDQIYTDEADEARKLTFENNRGKFSLVFLGMQESSGKDISFMGINESEPQVMVRKACQRALDENVANLQKNFDVFKIKSPLLAVDPLKCEIGKKEGVSESSRFEVLEAVEDEQGHVEYKRVGVIRPVKNMIWDNRYMAEEEGAEGAELGFTTFEKVSGHGFYPGMLIRELK